MTVGSEIGMRDHLEWCLGDAQANRHMLNDVSERDGDVTQLALVAAATQYRLAKQAEAEAKAEPRG